MAQLLNWPARKGPRPEKQDLFGDEPPVKLKLIFYEMALCYIYVVKHFIIIQFTPATWNNKLFLIPIMQKIILNNGNVCVIFG